MFITAAQLYPRMAAGSAQWWGLQVADRGMPSRVDKRVAPDREGAAEKQC